jgi:uncharacterized glyoxalase superfamily protein PhnB
MEQQVIVDLTVEDVAKTAEFYRKVGLDVPEVWEQDGVAQHVDIVGTGIMVNSRALTRAYDPKWQDTSGAVLIFHMPSAEAVDAKYHELTRDGYAGHLEPFDAFWGSRYAIVDDPDGNHVGLMAPRDREHGEVDLG